MQTICMDGRCLKNCQQKANGFKCVKGLSEFDERFIKNYDEIKIGKCEKLICDIQHTKNMLLT